MRRIRGLSHHHAGMVRHRHRMGSVRTTVEAHTWLRDGTRVFRSSSSLGITRGFPLAAITNRSFLLLRLGCGQALDFLTILSLDMVVVVGDRVHVKLLWLDRSG